METKIIADRERASMGASWTEFLCLEAGNNRKFRLFNGRYKSLAPSASYLDTETGEYSLPDEIDGETVVGTEDDWVVGGELSWYNVSDMVEFDDVEDPGLVDWLRGSGWTRYTAMEVIENAVKHATVGRD